MESMRQGQRLAVNHTDCLFYYPVILRVFCMMIFPFWLRWPHGVLHLQPRLCYLFLGGVLLPAVYCHSAGLHSHLRLPQDEAEEDHLRPGQRKGAARLNSTLCGETLHFLVLAFHYVEQSFWRMPACRVEMRQKGRNRSQNGEKANTVCVWISWIAQQFTYRDAGRKARYWKHTQTSGHIRCTLTGSL